MARPKLNLKSRTALDRILFAQSIHARLSNNPNFPTPSPSLETFEELVTAAMTAYQAQEAARTASQQATAVLGEQMAALDGALSRIASYVDSVAGGDEVTVLSAGLPVRLPSTALGVLPGPETISVRFGVISGTLQVRWAGVRGARAYEVQLTTDLTRADGWATCAHVARRSAEVSGLVSGQRYWFRVRAIGSAGLGAWSNPARGMAV
jgi:hypothetical protein